MFAPPRYGEIDPTPFFAPAFMIFFGLMLGDAGYGVIILIIAWLLYRGIGHRNFETGQMCIVLMGCGVADIIFGTLQGGWFGDLLPRFFGITPPFIFIEPLRSPILFFQLALIIGTIHINLGIFLGFWQSFKRNRYKEAVFEHLIWYVIQPAAAVLLVQFFGWMTPPPWATMSASVLLIVTFGLLFLSHGPMGFFSITGFLGDWLSYVRILALALATGGIAMTINLLAQMIAAVHPFMLIPAILFLIAGQTFNLIIQALGSVIHALRLHYIEFFGKFYTGGGKLFSPFCAHRVYTMKENRER
jgi:V/A-type H+-transporting ATPase subunit I